MMAEWRPITTLYSYDLILVSNGERVWCDMLVPLHGNYSRMVWNEWDQRDGDPAPTHWMPLPPPPVTPHD